MSRPRDAAGPTTAAEDRSHRDPAEAVIALGSNLADRAANLWSAVAALEAAAGVQAVAVSAVVATDPVGVAGQPEYLNAVAVLRTTLSPLEVLGLCHRIEASHDRRRDQRWAARTLDLDLITYSRNGSALTTGGPGLTLPHPRAHQRAFVLAPWLELQPAATLRLPDGTDRGIRELLARAPDRAGVRAGPAGALR
jgi:dihydroneopterin aldolase / 2-amino-4-hydroxy-6-hydroxymethyldihydropteridine diphosphokinase